MTTPGEYPTPDTPTPAPLELPECESEIQVHFSKQPQPTFEFTAMGYEQVVVTPDGQITVPDDHRVILTFSLTEASDASEIEGIQLGWFGPVRADTRGRYPMPELPKAMITELPFEVKSLVDPAGVRQALVVTDLNQPVCGVISYQLSVRDETGNRFSHDPKIYNKGDGTGLGRR